MDNDVVMVGVDVPTDIDLDLEDLTAEELQTLVSAWKCSATLSTVACWGCGTLSSGSSFSSAGSG